MSEKEKIKVGIISAPGRATDIAKNIIERLADQFSKQINEEINWEVDQITDPLTGAAETSQDILYNATEIKANKEWDYAICLTDLPIFHNKDIVAADISYIYKVAQISIPAFGYPPMQNRIEKSILILLSELRRNYIADESTFQSFKRQFPIFPIRRESNPNHSLNENLSSRNNKKQSAEDSQHAKFGIEEMNNNNIDIRFIVYPKIIGIFRLILGMTFANNPMQIMSSFKNVIAIAFTTGAFGLIFPTIWNLGQLFSVYRLSGMMFAAIFGLVFWIIIAHNLWEYPSKHNKPNIRRLYNLATIYTLLIDVVTYYVFMFVLFLIACLIFIPIDFFQSMIKDYDDIGSTFVNYMRVAWATASISTIVSAIGAGLENEDLVRSITYGYRQSRRFEKINRHKNS